MVISDRYKYLYFVTPKCGSATVRHALAPFTDIGYPVSNFEEHVTIRKFLAIYDDAGRYADYFKFTFVRNPYDRLYSSYRQDMRASTRWKQWIAAKKPIFDVIGDDFPRYLMQYVACADIRNAWDWISFCPMVEFTHLNGKPALDWIGRTETLDHDLRTLAGNLGIVLGDVRNLNVNVLPDAENPEKLKYLNCYTHDTVALVNDLYGVDFEAFGYPMLDPRDFPKTA